MRCGQRGVALAILLWFLAALSLLAAGIVATARNDTRLAAQQLDVVRAEALGDGAIELALAELLALQEQGVFQGQGIYTTEIPLGGRLIAVEILPSAGLIDLNVADALLLISLFMGAGGLTETEAEELALRVVEWRQAATEEVDLSAYQAAEMSDPRFEMFRVAEDLMQVVGIDRSLYERVEPFVFAGRGETVYPDPLSAPAELLVALFPDQADALYDFAEARQQAPFEPLALPPELSQAVAGGGFVSLLRATATLGEGSQRWQRRRWVQWGSSFTSVPWQFSRTEPVRALPRQPGDR